MQGNELVVLLVGVAAIAWVNWYFFVAGRRAVAARNSGAVQEIEIQVLGGYSPSVVRLKRGIPARLVFDRQEDSSCSEEVVLPALGIRRFLPAFRKTTIDVTPNESGAFDITCGMSMLHGKLIVED
jgi:plastocyanin domain-containing protein